MPITRSPPPPGSRAWSSTAPGTNTRPSFRRPRSCPRASSASGSASCFSWSSRLPARAAGLDRNRALLKDDPRPEPDDPRWRVAEGARLLIGRIQKGGRGADVDVQIRQRMVHVIECIDRLGPDLQMKILPNRETLVNREIQLLEHRPGERVARHSEWGAEVFVRGQVIHNPVHARKRRLLRR